MPRRHGHLVAGLAAVLLVAALFVVPASTPAYASAPRCTTQHSWHRYDYYGDRFLGLQPGFIDFTVWTPAARNNDGSYTWNCLLAQGSHNDAVYELQSEINACYGSSPTWGGVALGLHLAEDSDFGPATKAALVKIQKFHKITADGVYGPQTATTMRHNAWSNGGDTGTGPICEDMPG
ncbi:peptidoglycan-binding domain-containing protein [Hamadaea tsunoensis]|uniref:peptidoglycan-binding domain-containing protein n=1 Tax=Hamadaea tsunoensis TaxID=53368 RepID=UPI00040338FB|nr:peptidoglycan-binding domain-containing protein [Hamadaea tsunoensis]